MIDFPAKTVSNSFKIKELHKAIPDSLKNNEHLQGWVYNYFFTEKLSDYDPIGDSTFTPKGDHFLYKLKDTYFIDINGDGLLDFIHHPRYYMALFRDWDAYELYIKQRNGSYKWLTFQGFVTEMKFGKDGVLETMRTFINACCGSEYSVFRVYSFDKSHDQLVLIDSVPVLSCQFKK